MNVQEAIDHLQWNADFCTIDKLTEATKIVLDRIAALERENIEMTVIGNKLKEARGCSSASLEWVVDDTLAELERWIDATAKLNREKADLERERDELKEDLEIAKLAYDCNAVKTDILNLRVAEAVRATAEGCAEVVEQSYPGTVYQTFEWYMKKEIASAIRAKYLSN